MAKYTMELRDIVESGRNIFPFAYDFFDEKKRPEFERDFIRHFYFREIGTDTVDRFIWELEDKMKTVFPAYNAILKAGQIKYNVLDNYYLSETTKRSLESLGKTSGVSSTVGQAFDSQETTSSETRNTNGTSNYSDSERSESTRNGSSETKENGTSETTSSETVATDTDTTTNTTNGGSKTTTGTTTNTEEAKKRFLDTPQGQTDLTNSKYLTTLNHDSLTGNTSTNTTEKDATTQNVVGTVDTNTSTNGTSTGETSRDSTTTNGETTEGEATKTGESTTTDKATGESQGTFTGEQRTTADNNTRTERKDNTTETTEIIHKGNVGVDSDAVMLQKHVKWQKQIADVFRLFFDECEDLFMLVYN